MKKILFLSCIVLMFCACKTQSSKVSDYTEKVGDKSYLYVPATGEDKAHTPLVCRFLCTGDALPNQENKSSVCSSESSIFIKRSVIENSSFSNLLEQIDNSSDVIAKINQSTASKLNSLFEASSEFYSTSLGEPTTVCGKALSSDTSGAAYYYDTAYIPTSAYLQEFSYDFTRIVSSSPGCHVLPFARNDIMTDSLWSDVLTEESNLNSCMSNIDKVLDRYNFKWQGKESSTHLTERHYVNSYISIFAKFPTFTDCKTNTAYSRIHVDASPDKDNYNVTISTTTPLFCASTVPNDGFWHLNYTDKSIEHEREYTQK